MKIRRSLYVATAMVSLSCSPAFAQSGPDDPASTTNDQPNRGQVDEIIVTAQKRSENLQVVPVAVSAVKAEALEAAGITSLLDVKTLVPSLSSFDTQGYLTSNIRGVGSIGNGPGVEFPIAVYVDGVYIAAPRASALQLNNIQSVDVLKGPQGTLFGRNATGGLIQVTTRDPSSTPALSLELGYANYQTLTGKAYLSGGITNNIYADIAIQGKTQGKGWGTNLATGNDAYRDKENAVVRSKWIFEPGPDTRFTLIGDYSHSVNSLGTFTTIPGTPERFRPQPYPIAPDRGYDVNNGQDAYQKTDTGGVSLRAEQDFGTVRLSSISAYRKSRFDIANTFFFAPENLQYYNFSQKDRQYSQEFQLSSVDNAARLKWTAGLYYFDSKSGYQPINLFFDDLGLRQTSFSTTTARSWAGYGQASYEIFDATNVTVGLRYTTERRELRDVSQSTTVAVPFPPFSITIPATFPDQSVNYNKLTYRFGIDHRFSDQVFAYASVNRGFKSGGYNLLTLSSPSYAPEVLDAYEVGLKTDLLDRRLRVNTAAFYYDYTNLQIQRIGATPGVFNVVNGAKARVYGAEMDVTAVFSENFNITAGATVLDPKFSSFPGCPTGGVNTTDCAGNQLPLSAKLVTTLGLHYEQDFARGTLSADTNLYYNSGFFFEPDNVTRQPRYATVGASLKWQGESGAWVRIFGKNLTDRRNFNYAATQGSGNLVALFAEPRTYGVAVGFEY